jgi:hypothetical protein
LSLRNYILLDNQSLVHVFCNPMLVNGGKLPISSIADIDGFDKKVWFSEDAMTNILSHSQVKLEYNVSYDGDDFIIH